MLSFACLALVVLVPATFGSPTRAERGWVIRDIGTAAGHRSVAVAINDRDEVVVNGGSELDWWGWAGEGGSAAFLWFDGHSTRLGDLGGGVTRGVAINNHGDIVGESEVAAGVIHAFLWRNGRMTDLGALPGDVESHAVAVNDRGQVLVTSYRSAGDYPWKGRAFVWEAGKKRPLGAPAGGKWIRAVALNERGQVAGLAGNGTPDKLRAFLWQNGRMRTFSIPGMWATHGDYPIPLALNDTGEVAWTARDPTGQERAMLSRAGHSTELGSGVARALNNRGQVVFDAMLWQQGKTVGLGLGGSAINDAGQVIANPGKDYMDSGDIQSSSCWRAAVWENGTIVDLGGIRLNKSCDRPPHGNSFAIAINNKGIIVGYSDVGHHAVLWTPRGGHPSQ